MGLTNIHTVCKTHLDASYYPFCTNSGVTFFHSLERSGIGDSGATTLADALRVNQSLKILKYVMFGLHTKLQTSLGT